MNWIFPLRRIIPTAMLIFSMAFATMLYFLETYRAEKQYLHQQEQQITHNGYQLSTLIRDALSRDDWDAASRHLRSIVTLPGLRRAFVLDNRNQIRLTTDYRLKDKSYQSLPSRPSRVVLERVSHTLSGEIVHLRDGSLWAIYPVELPLQEGDIRSEKTGLLVLAMDLTASLNTARQTALENTLIIFFGSLIIGILFWGYLNAVLVKRLDLLSQRVKLWRSDKEEVPDLSGHDELAELSRHFTQVSREFGQQYGQLRALFEQSFQTIFIVNRSGTLVDANTLALQLVGADIEKLRGMKLWETPWWDYSPTLKKQLRDDLQLAAQGQHILRQIKQYDTQGNEFDFNYSFRPIREHQKGEVLWVLAEGRDVTELLEAEEGRRQLSSFFAMLSHSNSAIARAESEAELLPKICQIIVDQSNISGAWIGYINKETQLLEPVAVAQVDTAYLDQIEIASSSGTVRWYGPASKAIREKRATIYNDFIGEFAGWADEKVHRLAKEHNIAAAAALPLYRGRQLQGCLILYGSEKGVFTEDLVTLLEELADDISFALKGFTDRNELQLLAKVFDSAHESIIVTDPQRRVVVVNPAFTEFSGFEANEVTGESIIFLRPEGDSDEYFATMWDVVAQLGYWQGELFLRRKNGETFPALVSISTLRGSHKEITHYVCMATDISEHREAEERVRYLAYSDSLTGLPNRMLLYDRAEQILKGAESQQQEVAVLFLDLDRFKHVNESLGHTIGDSLLRMVAERLSSKLREQDSIGRLGGDEFLVILPGANANTAAHVASKLLQEFAQAFNVGQHTLNLTCSAGIALYPQDGDSFDELYQHADVAMYKAKEMGRNRYHFFTSELNAAATERLILENALRDAVDLGQMSLMYQPQINVSSGEVVSVEALLRWTHDRLGVISPVQFIPIAEETGQINRLGEWVLVEACRQHMRWQRQGLPSFVVAVNVSARQFVDAHIYHAITRALDETGLDARLLEIEITESVFAYDMEETLDTMRKITELGVQIAVDDFGTGYSSLSYLKRFPLKKLKIDRSFVDDIVTDKDDREIAAGIINLGHSLELSIIAEGVETPEQLAMLRRMQCDVVQGYLFSKPLPADALPEFIDRHNSGQDEL